MPFESSATSSSSSRSRPRSGLAATGRLVASSVRSGGKSPSPSWYRRSAPVRSFSRCSPSSRREASLVEEPRVVSETTICPPWAARSDARRAVDVDADVALVGHDRLARVEPHADLDRAVSRGHPALPRRPRRLRRRSETRRRRHRPACRPRRRECFAKASRKHPPVLGEEVGVRRVRAPGGAASSPRRRKRPRARRRDCPTKIWLASSSSRSSPTASS